MSSSLKQTLVKTSGLLAALAASDNSNVSVVTTDTLVIGGGAGGAHAAVRLTDYGQDVILVERQPILVGSFSLAERNGLEVLISPFRVVLSTASQIPPRGGLLTLVLETLRIMETSRVSLVALIFQVSGLTMQSFTPLGFFFEVHEARKVNNPGLKYCCIRDTLRLLLWCNFVILESSNSVY